MWVLYVCCCVFQVTNALAIRPAFTPDEHWQSLEVAHRGDTRVKSPPLRLITLLPPPPPPPTTRFQNSPAGLAPALTIQVDDVGAYASAGVGTALRNGLSGCMDARTHCCLWRPSSYRPACGWTTRPRCRLPRRSSRTQWPRRRTVRLEARTVAVQKAGRQVLALSRRPARRSGALMYQALGAAQPSGQ
jgi:hypothetical protein